MEIVPFVTESLGDSSYLIVAGDVAAVVDPQRDVRPYVEAAAQRGVRITLAFETHVHNDYISGGPELVALGATLVAPEAAGLCFAHRAVSDGDDVALGPVTLRAVAAPGHTFEHTAYLAIDEAGDVRAAFTGGSLIIGGAGRTDLLGPEHTAELTRLQWESGRRIASMLPAAAELLPTHGSGSFCSSGGGSERRATLAHEREGNRLLLSPTLERFHELHLASLAPAPRYYAHMAPINRAGAPVYGEPPMAKLLAPGDIDAALAAGVAVVDPRDRHDYVRAHVPGSVLIDEGESTLAYTGWTLPFDAPLALIVEDAAQAERTTTDLFRIGYEHVRGYLPYAAWRDAGRPSDSLAVATVDDIVTALRERPSTVLDVRFGYEHDAAPLPGARHLPIDRLPEWLGDVLGPVFVVCGSGVRATMAASFLAERGVVASPLIDGGAAAVLARLAEPSRTI